MSIDENKKTVGNPLWISGQSGNPSGRKKGAKRSIKTTIARFLLRNGSLKELQANYDLLKPGRERLDFILKLMPYHVAPIQSDSLSTQEIEELYNRLESKLRNDVNVQGKKVI